MSVKWDLIVVFIHISLMISDSEHISVCFLAIVILLPFLKVCFTLFLAASCSMFCMQVRKQQLELDMEQ